MSDLKALITVTVDCINCPIKEEEKEYVREAITNALRGFNLIVEDVSFP